MKKLIFILGVILLFAACVPRPQVMLYTNFDFMPTSSVEVLRTRPAEREYIELAEVSLRLTYTNRNNAVFILSEVARNLGADALILLGEKDSGSVILPFFGAYISEKTEKLVGIAIRYKQPESLH
jgi:hypothetical protein